MRLFVFILATSSALGCSAFAQKLEPPCPGDLAQCFTRAVHEAGRGNSGERLWLLEQELFVWEDIIDEGDDPCPNGWTRWWLYFGDHAPELMLDLCEEDHGTAERDGNEIKVASNTLIHTQQLGGSHWGNWRENRTLEMSLSPPVVLRRSSFGWSSLRANNEEASEFDFRTFLGHVEWRAPLCNWADLKRAEECEEGTRCVISSFSPIPNLNMIPTGADAARLGSCALTVDASGAGGYIVHGPAGAADDAQMRLVQLDDRLIVTIADDVWIDHATSPLHVDHLELWIGDSVPYLNNCIEPEDLELAQWLISVSDGAVRQSYGAAAEGPKATVRYATDERGRPVRTIDIELPYMLNKDLTIVYSDSDDGENQERLIATSDLKYGDPTTLGQDIWIGGDATGAPPLALCALRCARRGAGAGCFASGRCELRRRSLTPPPAFAYIAPLEFRGPSHARSYRL